MVQEFMVEKSGVGKFMVEKSGVEKSGVEMSFNRLPCMYSLCFGQQLNVKCVAEVLTLENETY